MVPRPCSPRSRRAPSTTSRTSFTPALTAERGTKRLAVASATTEARVVLPVPGRAPQDRRGQPVGLDERPQRRARADQVALADDLVEGAGPQAGGQRGPWRPGVLGRPGEQVVTGHGAPPQSFGAGRAAARARPAPAGASGLGAPVIGSAPGLGLREGDDLADAVLAGEDGHQPVDAHGEAGMGRRPVAEGTEQEPEAGLGLLLADAEHGEDPALDVARGGSGRCPSPAPSR